MNLNPGEAKWDVNAFDVFNDIPLSSILFVVPTVGACSSSSENVRTIWYTYDGNNKIALYTPIAQLVCFNCAVFYSV